MDGSEYTTGVTRDSFKHINLRCSSNGAPTLILLFFAQIIVVMGLQAIVELSLQQLTSHNHQSRCGQHHQ